MLWNLKKTNVNFVKFSKKSVLFNESINFILNFKNNNYNHVGLIKNEEKEKNNEKKLCSNNNDNKNN